jgi:hypothetical protein
MKKWILLSFASCLFIGCGDDAPNTTNDAATSDAATGDAATGDAATGGDADTPDAAVDATPAGDAAVGVQCGQGLCEPDQDCCVTDTGGGALQYECIPSGDICEGVSAECDGPEDCGGNACCATLMGTSVNATCDTEPECTGGLTLCHTSDDCPALSPNCCPLPQTGVSTCSRFMCL